MGMAKECHNLTSKCDHWLPTLLLLFCWIVAWLSVVSVLLDSGTVMKRFSQVLSC